MSMISGFSSQLGLVAHAIMTRKEAIIGGGLTYISTAFSYFYISQTSWCKQPNGSIKNACILLPIASALLISTLAKKILKVNYLALFSLGIFSTPRSALRFDKVNIIGSETYIKNCSPSERWSLKVSEEQAEKIASGVRQGVINMRLVQAGDNLGRIAEGLSEGHIQLQPEESSKPLATIRSWTTIPTQAAQGWKKTAVIYVYGGDLPSSNLKSQAEENRNRTLYEANRIFSGQYVGLTRDLKVVIGDDQDDVFNFIMGHPQVKELD